ncbi:MAG: class I SAM-dependent methyltransferase, partial [Hyphomicrobiales bacterium]
GGPLAVAYPDGTVERFGEGVSPVTLRVHDERLFGRVLRGGETALGEAYAAGDWSADDLPRLLALGLRNRSRLALSGPLASIASVQRRGAHRLRANTRAGSRRNIHEHYDLGNGFFALMLDETMTYSSAVFEWPGQDLAAAQRHKYALACAAARIKPGGHVLEIGCGWGGFAEYAVRTIGCRVTGITISEEQHAYASRRLAPFAGAAEVRLCDYRDIRGSYDAVVSIEMIEAVGARYLPRFFAACARRLRPGGRLFVQAIVVPERDAAAQRRGENWLQQYIFPGGELPSIAGLERAAGRAGLRLRDARDIGAHYVTTLQHWRERFDANRPAVRAMGFDARFERTWEYYLAACEAVFATGTASDVKLVFDRAG